MIVLCTGLIRSASTWSYNVCRALLEHAAEDVAQNPAGGYVDGAELDELIRTRIGNSERTFVLKSHFPGPQTRELIESGRLPNVCTLRDPRDCFVSLNAYGEMSFDAALDLILDNLPYIDGYRETDRTLFIDFAEIVTDSAAAVGRVAGYLGLSVSPEALAAVDERTNLDAARNVMRGLSDRKGSGAVFQVRSHLVDNETLIHEGHVSNAGRERWKTELSPAEQRRVNEAFAPWLARLGYESS